MCILESVIATKLDNAGLTTRNVLFILASNICGKKMRN